LDGLIIRIFQNIVMFLREAVDGVVSGNGLEVTDPGA
jgi:hypothetical protein